MAIACSCHGLRDAEVVDVIRDGARSVEDVMSQCEAGGNCGSCVSTIEMLIAVESAVDAAYSAA
jgi:bacterioferritin-associated ferredoxin